MKKVYLFVVLLILGSTFSMKAQGCYDKYHKAFVERGAEDVLDSTYSDIIISIREGETNNCYLGQVTVRNGKVLVDNFYIKLEDGSLDNLGPRLKTKQPVTVKNGVSQIILDNADNLYNVIFIGHIKPKKKGFMKAPDFDLN